MTETTPTLYHVIFRGQLREDSDPGEVKLRLAELLKKPPEKIEALFSGKPVALARQVEEAKARRYQERLAKIGAICELRAVAPPSPPKSDKPAPVMESPPLPPVSDENKTPSPPKPKPKPKPAAASPNKSRPGHGTGAGAGLSLRDTLAVNSADARSGNLLADDYLVDDSGMSARETMQAIRKIFMLVGAVGLLLGISLFFLPSFFKQSQEVTAPVAVGEPGTGDSAGQTDPETPAWSVPEELFARLEIEGTGQLVAFSDDDHQLLVQTDKSASLYSLPGGEGLQTYPQAGIAAAALAREEGILALANAEGVQLWDIYTGASVGELEVPDPPGRITTLAFAPRGGNLAGGRANPNERNLVLWSTAAGQVLNTLGTPEGAKRMAFGPDLRYLAVVGNRTLALWEISPDRLARKREFNAALRAVAFNPLGGQVAVGDRDGFIHLYSIPELEKENEFHASEAAINALAFHPDGEFLAAANGDGEIYFWRVEGGDAPPRELKAHGQEITALAFGEQGELLAAASADQSVSVWKP